MVSLDQEKGDGVLLEEMSKKAAKAAQDAELGYQHTLVRFSAQMYHDIIEGMSSSRIRNYQSLLP